MEKALLLILIFIFVTPGLAIAIAAMKEYPKLIVFGDSYSDTGNWKKGSGSSWNPPYGITFPGIPTGRFSDGRVLTDFIASYMGIETPVPYAHIRRHTPSTTLNFGVNFAYGGTGVFDTDTDGPNMTTQIHQFQNLLHNLHLHSSVALVTVAGNDYTHYLTSGSQMDMKTFTRSIVKQIASNLHRIHTLGVPKIVIAGIEPLGCLPAISVFSSYSDCIESFNAEARFHNRLLRHAVEELNKESQAYLFLDLYGAFMSGLNITQKQSGTLGHENQLKPCCEGVNSSYSCGSRHGNEAMYTVCRNPEGAFFWDSVHPAQNGWYQVFLFIRSSLRWIL